MEIKPIPPKLRTILESQRIRKVSTVLYDTTQKYNGAGATVYGAAALERQCEIVASAADGNRNTTLNTAAFSIGQLVAGGEINHDLALGKLVDAAGEAGLTPDEAERTAESGLSAGMEHPRSSKPLENEDFDDVFWIDQCPDPASFQRLVIPDLQDEALQLWVIDNASKFARLKSADLARAKMELNKRGIKKGFLEKDFAKILKEIKGETEEPEQESLWEKCIEDLSSLGYSFRMNQLDDCVEVNGERISDGLDAQIVMEMFDKGWNNQGEGGAAYIRLAFTAEAHQRRHHPVKDFLNALVWDGKDWIAEMERYIRDKHPQIVYEDGSRLPVFGAFLKRWGIGAVGKVLAEGDLRVQNPMLVFAGAQGCGKSTLARFLCPMSDAFYIENPIDPESNDHLRYLATKLVWEVAELGATTRKADRESLKAFLTKQDVTFRVPYNRHPVNKPALTSFVGTINPEIGFLNDPTGNRRFLPVEIASIDFKYREAIDPAQLWAQFVALYRAGEPARLTPEEKAMADSIRYGHEIEDPYLGFVTKYYTVDLDRTIASSANIEWSATTTEVVEQLAMNGVTGVNTTNIGLSLVKLGLIKARQRVNGVQETRWYGLKRNSTGFRVSAIER